MFVLEWTAYPWISLAVGIPLALLYAVERRREVKADRAYDAVARPCMVHVGTDTDRTELWCWQRAGHSGPHDDSSAYEEMITLLRDWKPQTDAEGELIGFTTPNGTRIPCLRSSNCVHLDGHEGLCDLKY